MIIYFLEIEAGIRPRRPVGRPRGSRGRRGSVGRRGDRTPSQSEDDRTRARGRGRGSRRSRDRGRGRGARGNTSGCGPGVHTTDLSDNTRGRVSRRARGRGSTRGGARKTSVSPSAHETTHPRNISRGRVTRRARGRGSTRGGARKSSVSPSAHDTTHPRNISRGRVTRRARGRGSTRGGGQDTTHASNINCGPETRLGRARRSTSCAQLNTSASPTPNDSIHARNTTRGRAFKRVPGRGSTRRSSTTSHDISYVRGRSAPHSRIPGRSSSRTRNKLIVKFPCFSVKPKKREARPPPHPRGRTESVDMPNITCTSPESSIPKRSTSSSSSSSTSSGCSHKSHSPHNATMNIACKPKILVRPPLLSYMSPPKSSRHEVNHDSDNEWIPPTTFQYTRRKTMPRRVSEQKDYNQASSDSSPSPPRAPAARAPQRRGRVTRARGEIMRGPKHTIKWTPLRHILPPPMYGMGPKSAPPM